MASLWETARLPGRSRSRAMTTRDSETDVLSGGLMVTYPTGGRRTPRILPTVADPVDRREHECIGGGPSARPAPGSVLDDYSVTTRMRVWTGACSICRRRLPLDANGWIPRHHDPDQHPAWREAAAS